MKRSQDDFGLGGFGVYASEDTHFNERENQQMSLLELNQGDNFMFGMDVSASMQTKDCPGGKERIEYLKEKAILFATEASKFDPDGIDVITFGAKVQTHEGVTAENAAKIINALKANEMSTDTAALINTAYKLHKSKGYEQTVLFICTDGEPADQQAVFKCIAEITQNLKNEHEFAISFLTVGNIAPSLQAFLTKLDDDLPGAKHDIVDVKALADVDFLEAFAGALHD